VQFSLPIRFKVTEKTVPAPLLPPPPPLNNGCEELFKVVEEMPRFPGCEELVDEAERKNCSDRLFLQYLHANLKLTPLQTQSCASGMVVIQFVIEKDGMVTDARIVRDIGVGYGQSALEAVESMNANGIRWQPGRQGGRAVRVQYNVPIRICLE
jgi:protein TonB